MNGLEVMTSDLASDDLALHADGKIDDLPRIALLFHLSSQ